MERTLAGRAFGKAKFDVILSYLNKNKNHWEETFWWLLARNFGIKVNADAFEKMAQSLSITLLAKHKNQVHQTEAFAFWTSRFIGKRVFRIVSCVIKK
ncbi:MAG: DUF2851 family protein [Ferruginibacter sp.]